MRMLFDLITAQDTITQFNLIPGKLFLDTNQVTFDSTFSILSDSVVVSGTFDLPDTFKVVDVSNYIEHPAFLLSLLTIAIALFAIFKPIIDQYITRRNLKKYTLFFAQQLIECGAVSC